MKGILLLFIFQIYKHTHTFDRAGRGKSFCIFIFQNSCCTGKIKIHH